MVLNNQSRPVTSSQQGIHPRLPALLKRYAAGEWRQPLHYPSVQAFEAFEKLSPVLGESLILDSGCGTGASTRALAAAFPDCLVIGVDKSAARLARVGAAAAPRRDGNAAWLRCELETFWRLALLRGWRLQRHYLLYPNPWPRPAQLQRRWHAHPVLADVLRLGGRLELRCNWKPYAMEFAFAVNRLCGSALEPRAIAPNPPLSPFERKYSDSGHALYSVVVPAESSRVK